MQKPAQVTRRLDVVEITYGVLVVALAVQLFFRVISL